MGTFSFLVILERSVSFPVILERSVSVVIESLLVYKTLSLRSRLTPQKRVTNKENGETVKVSPSFYVIFALKRLGFGVMQRS